MESSETEHEAFALALQQDHSPARDKNASIDRPNMYRYSRKNSVEMFRDYQEQPPKPQNLPRQIQLKGSLSSNNYAKPSATDARAVQAVSLHRSATDRYETNELGDTYNKSADEPESAMYLSPHLVSTKYGSPMPLRGSGSPTLRNSHLVSH